MSFSFPLAECLCRKVERVSIPISTCLRRFQYLRSMLASLAKNSARSHEVILVTEDDPDELRALAEPLVGGQRLRVAHATPITEKTNPVYEFIDVGAILASEPWIVVPAGDDSYFQPGWEVLVDVVNPAERLRSVWVPRYHTVVSDGSREPGFRQKVGSHDGERFHEFRFCTGPLDSIAESELLAEVEGLREERVVREHAGDRFEVSWPHAVMARELFATAGFYGTVPPFPAAHDIRLHERFNKQGVTSVGVLASVISNVKVAVRLGE